jgi:hypothetical protein
MSEPFARPKRCCGKGQAAFDIRSVHAIDKGGRTMCCIFTILLLLGPRVGGAIWWLVSPVRWSAAFNGSWLWPLLGILFLPWTTLMYVIVSPLGVVGWDWLWIGLAVASDIAWYAGGGFRKRVPGYSGQY